mmetsp:Transcript_3840/g.5629  ORF Transcript_3840/g.5629 Transcript_3840/m.5629 type:complete len:253 (-) Transcript_3840:92-850(-)|eukprot:CAMPEP_0195514030 /NCGR_PEP_ID=MMETSP0794_2-20130614/5550_1 /TAXON_ID=515487 /ORGANISM="Stephanopyxis turris, Strain CCMP 815" /LENGTH=252 /DNA_ID=CAMNT_0040642193 /DNA_START=37 /DNA_END=795 /DNA_ORIENTATION=+
MANYLNEFIETIQAVPDEVQRNFCLIRELDKTFSTQQSDLLKLHKDYLEDLRKRTEDKDGLGKDPKHLLNQDVKLKRIRLLYNDTLQQADEKIAIAKQSYDLVDEHIKRLDLKLRQFEEELTHSGHFNRAYATGGVAGGELAQGSSSSAGTENDKKSGRKNDKSGRSRKRKSHQQASAASQPAFGTHGAFVPAGEPLYCVCKRPSFGKMVGCENDDCEIAWYHFECVGLEEQPPEDTKWYCPTCIAHGFGKS